MVPINSENNLETPQPATILAVDDTPENLRLLDRLLTDRGYKMRLAPSGRLALKSASVQPPDLILLDILMPGLDGYEVCSRLKADPLTRNIPVIFLSAKGEVFDKIKAFDLGAVDYITKPFATEEVAARIERQLTIWQLSKELVQQNNLLQEELEQLRNADISNIDVLRERLSERIDNFNETNNSLQQQIALREKELRDRQILETELQEQNARLQEEVRERKRAEETLRERERFIEQITETSPTLLYIFDVIEQRNVYCNRATADMLGYSPQDILTMRENLLAKVMYPDDLIKIPEKLRQISALRDGDVLESEYRLRDARGQWRTFFARQLVFSRTPEGEVRQVLGTAVDITDRVAAETALKKNAEFLRSIYSGVEIGIFIVDVSEEGEFRYAGLNPTHERISGIKASELRGKTPEEVLPEGAARAVRDRYQNCVEARTSITYEECLFFQGQDTCWITKLTPLFDTNENLYRIVGTSLNITERKQAEIALRDSQRLLQQISESSPNILYLYDLVENRNVYSNCSTAEILGYSPEEIAAMGEALLPTIMHPEDFAKVPELQKQISSFNDGEVLEHEYRLRDRRTGEWRTFFVREVVFSRTQDGKVKQILGTAVDITDRVNAEREREELLERERLAREEAQAAKEQLARNLDSMTDAFIALDSEFRFTYTNEKNLEFAQKTRGELLGNSIWEVFPELIGSNAEREFRLALSERVSVEFIYFWPPRNCWFEVRAYPTKDGLWVYSRDVSDRVNAEREREELLERERSVREEAEAAKEKLAHNLDSMTDMFVSLDSEWRYTYVNKHYELLMQKTRSEFLGNCIWEVFPSLIDTNTERELRRSLSEQVAVEFINFWSPLNSWFEIRAYPTKDGLSVYVCDVSDRVNAERERQELLERERLAREEAEVAKEQLVENLESITDAFIALDSEWKYTYVNKHYETIAQKKRSELLGKIIWELFPQLIGTNAERQFRRALSERVAVEFIEFWSPVNIWFEVRAYPTKDGLSIYGCDVTDRVNAEILQRETAEREKTLAAAIQRIRESLDIETIFTATTEQLRQALQCSRVAIYRFDADFDRGEFVAESAEEELLLLQSQREPLGLTAESELLQNSCLQVLIGSPDEAKRRNCNLDEPCCLAVADIEEVNYSDEYRQRLAEFEIRAYIIIPIFCNSQFWGLLGAYHSSAPRQWQPGERNMALQIGNQLGVALQQAELLGQTKRQAAELEKTAIAADAANRAKSEFLANMSHELRTPLNAILGFTQVMGRDRSLSSQHQNNLTIINRAGEHLLALINDILEMSKIEADRATFNESTFNLTAMLETLESMLKFKAQSKRLELTFDLPPNLPPGVKTDEGKLRQVLINILGNAIKFTERGGVSLRLEIENNSRLLFEIEDTGPGIAPEEMESLFEAFGQTKVGRQYQQGTGLGLPISKKFVELMGGKLRVSSKVGEGSVFAFDVLITAVEGVAVTSSNRGRAIALAPGTPEHRILAVDDRADNRHLLETLLSSIGFQVRTAENGEEALVLWSSWEPHLILMDMQMPVMDGFAATQRIKATDKGRKTAILALTASAFEEDRQQILAAGCDDFASKPFQEDILLEKIGDRLGIEYIYENGSQQLQEESKISEEPLTIAQLKEYLSQMPSAWVEEIYSATIMGADDTILELLEHIPPELNTLAQTLEDLTNNYQFEVILEGIELTKN